MKWKNKTHELTNELHRLSRLEAHELLNVPLNANTETIKSAYYKMVKVYHPDKAHPFMREYNEQVMKLLNRAYSYLTSGVK